jgi:hypothetical protein
MDAQAKVKFMKRMAVGLASLTVMLAMGCSGGSKEMDHPLLGSWVFADFSRTSEWYFDRFGTLTAAGVSMEYSVDMSKDPILITMRHPEHGVRYALFAPAGAERGQFVVGNWNADAPRSFPSGRMIFRDPNEAARHAVQRRPMLM